MRERISGVLEGSNSSHGRDRSAGERERPRRLGQCARAPSEACSALLRGCSALQRHQPVLSGQLRPPSAVRHEKGRSASECRGSDPPRDPRKERKEKRMKAGLGPPPAGPPSGACSRARCSHSDDDLFSPR